MRKNKLTIAKINKFLEDEILNLDAILFMSYVNRVWFAQIETTAGYILITKNKNYLLIDSRYYEKLKTDVQNIDEVILVKNYNNTLLDLLKSLEIKNIGFSSEHTTYKQINNFIDSTNKNKDMFFKPVEFDSLRTEKRDDEIRKIKKAIEITENSIKYAIRNIKVGMTELQIAGMIEQKYKELGSREVAFSTIVASGPNSAHPHHLTSNRIIEKGDFVVIDTGCKFKGYCSDVTRTITIGKPTPKQLEIYKTVLKAANEAINCTLKGQQYLRIDGKAREVIINAGYGEYFTHGTGHGLGVIVHEDPYVIFENEGLAKLNEVVTIEPGIYIPEYGGVRIENDILITEDGCEVLNKMPFDKLLYIKVD